jgi:hypothetical protein
MARREVSLNLTVVGPCSPEVRATVEKLIARKFGATIGREPVAVREPAEVVDHLDLGVRLTPELAHAILNPDLAFLLDGADHGL